MESFRQWFARHLWLVGWFLLTFVVAVLTIWRVGLPDQALFSGLAPTATTTPPPTQMAERRLVVTISDPLHTLRPGQVVTLVAPPDTATPTPGCSTLPLDSSTSTPSDAGASPSPAPASITPGAGATPSPAPTASHVLRNVSIVSVDQTARLSMTPPAAIAAQIAMDDTQASCDTLARFASASVVYPVFTPTPTPSSTPSAGSKAK